MTTKLERFKHLSYNLFIIVTTAFLFTACSDSTDDSDEETSGNAFLTLIQQSIAEGEEIDATKTTVLTLTYDNFVNVSPSANITLNGTKLYATVHPTYAKAVDIALKLEENTDYTLHIEKGAFISRDGTGFSPEFSLTFKTVEAIKPDDNSTTTPSNKPVAATTEPAIKLYNYLKNNYGQKTISSVMANVNWNNEEAERIGKAIGKYPAMNCYDFIHICYSPANWINYDDITPVQEWVAQNGLVSLMWHFNVPKSQGSSDYTCTPSETTFNVTNVFNTGSWENKWFYSQMDKVVAVLLKLQNAGIAATWRPFHEAAGNATYKTQAQWTTSWFWWGYAGADIYKRLWKTMFDYFQQKGIHNLIWIWTTQNYNGNSASYNNDADWYPGDAYVDIIARDLYGYTAQQNRQEFSEIQARYPDKMIILGECGKDVSKNSSSARVSDWWTTGAHWGQFMVWYGANMEDDNWWKDALNNVNVITRDQVDLSMGTDFESATIAVRNMGLGWNLGNTLDSFGSWIGNNQAPSKYETAWGQPITKAALMTFLKSEGFNAVRVPVTWWQHLDSNDNIDALWMDRVQEVVDYVINAGMYCIINVHHDTGSGEEEWLKADLNSYETNNARFVKIWQQIATRFINYGNLLLFEGYNEMLDANNQWNQPKATSSYTAVNQFAQSFVNTIRATGGNNAMRNLIVTTYSAASNQQVLNYFNMPTDPTSDHLIAEVHSYDPYNWFSSKGSWTDACSNEIKNMFSRLNNKFVSKGIPVIIGEYGTNGETSVSASSTTTQIKAAADHAADMVRQARELGIATFYWMGLIDGKDRNVPKWTLPTVVDAMKSAYNKE